MSNNQNYREYIEATHFLRELVAATRLCRFDVFKNTKNCEPLNKLCREMTVKMRNLGVLNISGNHWNIGLES